MKRIQLAAFTLALAPAVSAQTWTEIGPGSDSIGLTLDPADPAHFFVRRQYTSDINETFDGGVTWSTLTHPSGAAYGGIVVSVTGEVFYFARQHPAPTGGAQYVYRRTQNGWQAFGPTFTASTPHYCSAFVVGRQDPDRMAIVIAESGMGVYEEDSYLYLSSDGGGTWSGPLYHHEAVFELDIVEAASGPRLYRTSGIVPSTGRITRGWVSAGWSTPLISVFLFQCDEAVETTTSTLFQERMYRTASVYWPGFVTRIQRSDDGGLSWSAVGPLAEYGSISRGASDPDLVVAFDKILGPQLSRDGGLNWTGLSQPPGSFGATFVLSPDETSLYAYRNTLGLWRRDLDPSIGTSECSSTVNGSGTTAHVTALGSTSIQEGRVTVRATGGNPGVLGLFIVSRTTGFVPHPGGSFGNLCLAAPIGRYVAQAGSLDGAGGAVLSVDLGAMPQPTASVPAVTGDTWRFQLWYRDYIAGQSGSNFSDAVAVTFTP